MLNNNEKEKTQLNTIWVYVRVWSELLQAKEHTHVCRFSHSLAYVEEASEVGHSTRNNNCNNLLKWRLKQRSKWSLLQDEEQEER